jgi:hypothetical protein
MNIDRNTVQATTFEAGRMVVRVAARLAQAVLSAAFRAGPLRVGE